MWKFNNSLAREMNTLKQYRNESLVDYLLRCERLLGKLQCLGMHKPTTRQISRVIKGERIRERVYHFWANQNDISFDTLREEASWMKFEVTEPTVPFARVRIDWNPSRVIEAKELIDNGIP